MIRLLILGKPFGKQRPKFSRRGGFVKTYTPKETISYENYVKTVAISEMKDTGFTGWFEKEPLRVDITAYYEIPNSWSKKKKAQALNNEIMPCVKPDVDNCVKALFDALNEVLWQDDTQVCDLHISKYYSDRPRIEMEISEWKI